MTVLTGHPHGSPTAPTVHAMTDTVTTPLAPRDTLNASPVYLDALRAAVDEVDAVPGGLKNARHAAVVVCNGKDGSCGDTLGAVVITEPGLSWWGRVADPQDLAADPRARGLRPFHITVVLIDHPERPAHFTARAVCADHGERLIDGALLLRRARAGRAGGNTPTIRA